MEQIRWDAFDTQDICVYDCFCLSHIREKGRTNDSRKGRRNSGFLYLFSGCVSLRNLDGSVLTAHAGELVLIPEGAKYLLTYEEQTHSYVINFRTFIPGSIRQTLCSGPMVVAAKSEQLEHYFQSIAATTGSSLAAEQFKLKQVLYHMFEMLSQNASAADLTQDRRTEKIAPGVLMLKQRLRENIPVEELAQTCNLSVSAFRKLFVACYGMAPIQYRNQLRLQHAKLLLQKEDNLSVEEIAEAIGFQNISYFCRQYKKFTGQRPKQAR